KGFAGANASVDASGGCRTPAPHGARIRHGPTTLARRLRPQRYRSARAARLHAIPETAANTGRAAVTVPAYRVRSSGLIGALSDLDDRAAPPSPLCAIHEPGHLPAARA